MGPLSCLSAQESSPSQMYSLVKLNLVFSPRRNHPKIPVKEFASPILEDIKLCSSLLDELNDSCVEALEAEGSFLTCLKEKESPPVQEVLVDTAIKKDEGCIKGTFEEPIICLDEDPERKQQNLTVFHHTIPRRSSRLQPVKEDCSLSFYQPDNDQYLISNKPPENELQKVGERVMSEHELRVQRSLQRLNLPDWYKNCPALPAQGFLLGKRNSDAAAHWPGLTSKTTSLSSLGSTQSAAATPRSPTTGHLLSPSPTPSGGVGGFTRWSTSRLNSSPNSASTSPSGSARSSFNYRQPYLGWRSQERIARPRTPAERLAAGLLPLKQQQQNVPNLSEVHTSIKEVTSAIANYVSKGDDRLSPALHRHDHASSRSASPRGSKNQLCWLESSFVGSKPIEVPETPLTATPPRAVDLHLDLKPSSNLNSKPALMNDAL